MRRRVCLAAAILLFGLLVVAPAEAPARADTTTPQENQGTYGWYWPVGVENTGTFYGFAAPVTFADGSVKWHLGADFPATDNHPVFAVAAGEVVYVNQNAQGYGGSLQNPTPGGVVGILHQTADGRTFYALYGHLRSIVVTASNLATGQRQMVKAGQVIGYIGNYSPFHLHFGIHPDWPTTAHDVAGWGGLFQAYAPQGVTAGWVDPITFLKDNRAPGAAASPSTSASAGAVMVDNSNANGIAQGVVLDARPDSAKIEVINNYHFWVAVDLQPATGNVKLAPADVLDGGLWAAGGLIPPGGHAMWQGSFDATGGSSQAVFVHFDLSTAGGSAALAGTVLSIVADTFGDVITVGSPAALQAAISGITQGPNWQTLIETMQKPASQANLLDAVPALMDLLGSKSGSEQISKSLEELSVNVSAKQVQGLDTFWNLLGFAQTLRDLVWAGLQGHTSGVVSFHTITRAVLGASSAAPGSSQAPPNGPVLFADLNEVVLADLDGSNRRILATGEYGPVYGPRWSPDGASVAFVGDVNDEGWAHGIWVVNADGTGLRQVNPQVDLPTDGWWGYGDVTWSPDGSHIAVTYTHLSQSDTVEPRTSDSWVLLVDPSSEATRILAGPLVSEDLTPRISWSGNSPTIIASASKDTAGSEDHWLVGIDATTGKITDPLWPVSAGEGMSDAAISPDGQLVAYTGYVGTPTGGWSTQLMVANADGTNRRAIGQPDDTAHLSSPSWSPDGRWLVCSEMITHTDNTNSERVVVLDLNGNRWQPASIEGSGDGVKDPSWQPAKATASVPSVESLFPVSVGSKWGYIDRTGKVVVQPQFDWADDFSEGFARVSMNGKWGYVDTTGKIVIQPRFDGAGPFFEGRAAVDVGENTGFVDTTGTMVIQPQFALAQWFSDGLVEVCSSLDQQYFYIDKAGVIVIPHNFKSSGMFYEGLASVSLDGRTWGFMDKTGTIVIQPQFDEANDFSEGLAPVRSGDKWGYIDKTGAMVIQPRFYPAHGFSEGLAAVGTDGKWGYVDESGRWVIQPQFGTAGDFSEGLAAVCADGKWGYVDESGRWVIQPQFKDAWPFANGLAFVNLDTEGGYIDKMGSFVWKGEARVIATE